VIRSALIALWVCAATVAGGYAGAKWQPAAKHEAEPIGMEKATLTKLRPMSVPIIIDAKVAGYIVCQFSLLASAETLKSLAVKPDVFVFDAAFKGIYSGQSIDLTKLTKDRWSELAGTVKQAVNDRYGREVLRDLVLEDFTFVTADMARQGGESGDDARPAQAKKKLAH
jgi:hypothetical protein